MIFCILCPFTFTAVDSKNIAYALKQKLGTPLEEAPKTGSFLQNMYKWIPDEIDWAQATLDQISSEISYARAH